MKNKKLLYILLINSVLLKKKIFYLVLCCLVSISKAQDTSKNFFYYDSETYRLYTQQKWDSLITLTNEALKKNFDTYYLRMRIGIAYYEKKQYNKAIPHFEKAFWWDKNDIVAEYLYFSYFFDGQYRRSKYFTKQMSDELIKKLKISRPKKIESLSISLTTGTINNWDNIKDFYVLPNKSGNYRLEKYISGPFSSIDIGLNNDFSQQFTVYSRLSLHKVECFQLLYYDYNVQHKNDYLLKEIDFNISLTHWKDNKNSTFVFNFQNLQSNLFEYIYSGPVFSHSNPPKLLTYNYEISQSQTNQNTIFFGYMSTKYRSQGYRTISVGGGKILSIFVIYANYSLNFTNKLKTLGSTTTLSTSIDINHIRPNPYIEQTFFVVPFKKLEVVLDFLYGRALNTPNPDFSVVYNTTYAINNRLSTSLYYTINKHLHINIGYIYQTNQQEDFFFTVENISKGNNFTEKLQITSYKFKNQIFTGGIIWKF